MPVEFVAVGPLGIEIHLDFVPRILPRPGIPRQSLGVIKSFFSRIQVVFWSYFKSFFGRIQVVFWPYSSRVLVVIYVKEDTHKCIYVKSFF